MSRVSLSRRRLRAGAAGAVGVAVLQRVALTQIEVPPDPTKVPGRALTALGQRSPFERPRRLVSGVNQGTSLTPLQDLCGIVTPSDLHYERSEEHTSELQSLAYLVCRLLLEKKKQLTN